jgi:hypothetical protein
VRSASPNPAEGFPPTHSATVCDGPVVSAMDHRADLVVWIGNRFGCRHDADLRLMWQWDMA